MNRLTLGLHFQIYLTMKSAESIHYLETDYCPQAMCIFRHLSAV